MDEFMILDSFVLGDTSDGEAVSFVGLFETSRVRSEVKTLSCAVWQTELTSYTSVDGLLLTVALRQAHELVGLILVSFCRGLHVCVIRYH
jgi:hypothetical protein